RDGCLIDLHSGKDGGAEGDGTPDLRNAIATLSQLSYGPNPRMPAPLGEFFIGANGKSDQLSSSSSPLVTPRSSSSVARSTSSSALGSSSSSGTSSSDSQSSSFFSLASASPASKGMGCFDFKTGSGIHSVPHSMQCTGSSFPRS